MHWLTPPTSITLAAVALMATVAPAADLASRLQTALTPHPRLLLTAAALQNLKAGAAGDPTTKALLARLFAEADVMLTQPPPQHTLTGRRMTAVSQDAQRRIATCALAYRLTGDRKYFDAARSVLLTVSRFDDYNPSHFLDVGEMAAALGIGYDWLYDTLTPEERTIVRRAIVDKCLRPSFADPPLFFVTAKHNWNQVCNGGLSLGALSIADEEPQLARDVLGRAISSLPLVMRQYGPDGAYPEGYSYWAYGTSYNMLLIAGLRSALGDDFGLTATPGFLATSDYHLHLVGPTGLNFSYGDGNEQTAARPTAAAFYLAGVRGDPSLLYYEQRALQHWLATPVTAAALGQSETAWRFLLLSPSPAARPATQPAAPSRTHYVAGGDTPVATHRTGWDDNATFVAIKAGSVSTNHAHMDVGSFCLDAGHVRWAGDPGGQDYNGLETRGIDLWNTAPASTRWQVYRIGPLSHNILTVNGKPQIIAGHATIVRSNEQFTVIDTTPVYAGELSGATRGVALQANGVVRVQDEVTALNDTPADLRWAMLTHADVKLNGGEAQLTQAGQTLRVRIVSPNGARFTVESTDPPHDYDAPNTHTRLLTVHVALPAAAHETIAIDLSPGEQTHDVASVQPLNAWTN